MSSTQSSDVLDLELLELAETTLVATGYAVQRATAGAIEVLLAEAQNNVVILAAVVSVEAALQVEPEMTEALARRFDSAARTPKRWDGYVVIISAARAPASLGEPLYALTYNLTRVRRIIRVNVRATHADVQRALAPLLPLAAADAVLPPTNALQSLEGRLLADGVPSGEVETAMAEFRSQLGEAAFGDLLGEDEEAEIDVEDEDR